VPSFRFTRVINAVDINEIVHNDCVAIIIARFNKFSILFRFHFDFFCIDFDEKSDMLFIGGRMERKGKQIADKVGLTPILKHIP